VRASESVDQPTGRRFDGEKLMIVHGAVKRALRSDAFFIIFSSLIKNKQTDQFDGWPLHTMA
jgi:hypothetical protein